MSRINPQSTIVCGVGASLATSVLCSTMLLMLYYNVSPFPPKPGSQNITTTQSPSRPNSDNPAVYLALSIIIPVSFALYSLRYVLCYAKDMITPRQRQLAAASGAVGMLAAADAIALPLTEINLARRNLVSIGVGVGLIMPAFLAVYFALCFAAIRLYNASLQTNDMLQERMLGDHQQISSSVNQTHQIGDAPQQLKYGTMWSSNDAGQENVDNGSQSSMSTVNSARSLASVDTTYGLNRDDANTSLSH